MIDDVVECGNVENGSSRREVEEYSWRARMLAEMRENVVEVVERGEWSGYSGRFVNEVERSIETITGKRALLTNSGTSALECALAAAGVAEGMEVIIPCVAPHAALQGTLRVGATPVLCRVDDTTLTIDAADLDRRRTGRTAAVIFVYALGNPTGIAEVARWCHRNGITLIEDAASAFGASIGGRGVGSWGGAAILSFNHTKQLNCGEGGAVITGDPKTYDAARALRHGGLRRGALEYHEAVAIGGKFLVMPPEIGLVIK
jgi:dTDP-4-amino-4,6-dideoxygalactose transaminase